MLALGATRQLEAVSETPGEPEGAYEHLVWGEDANASEFITEEHRQELIVSRASIHGDTEFAFAR